MNRITKFTTFLIGCLLLLPALSSAQTCGWCDRFDCPPSEHKFVEGDTHKNPHETCALPIYGCGCDNHPICEDTEEEEEALVALIDAALAGDPLAMVAPSLVLYDRVGVNLDRGSLQIRACRPEGGVVANLPMPRTVLVALGDALEAKRIWASSLR